MTDFKIGDQLALPQLEVSLEEMVAFAKGYDPLTIHIDPSSVEARALRRCHCERLVYHSFVVGNVCFGVLE